MELIVISILLTLHWWNTSPKDWVYLHCYQVKILSFVFRCAVLSQSFFSFQHLSTSPGVLSLATTTAEVTRKRDRGGKEHAESLRQAPPLHFLREKMQDQDSTLHLKLQTPMAWRIQFRPSYNPSLLVTSIQKSVSSGLPWAAWVITKVLCVIMETEE